MESLRTHRRRIAGLLEAAGPERSDSWYTDLFLMVLISLNVLAAVLESVPAIGEAQRAFFHGFEILSVSIFSVEYLARLWSCVESADPRFQPPLQGRLRYAVTPMAVIDLLAVLPFFLSAILPLDLRFLRVLRVLRIFKLSHYFSALGVLLDVVRGERFAFAAAFFLLVLGMVFSASGIYLFEHVAQPEDFGSIPAAMWWAVATLTTVGYGDVTPITVGGKIFGASITIVGVGMVALPTSILAAGFAQEVSRRRGVYRAELHEALADGIIDRGEAAELEELRQELGLSHEQVEGLGRERRSPVAAVPLAECPHCGEKLSSA